MDTVITRVFMNGDSQAVRIPVEFQLNADLAEISRTPDGDLIIRAVAADRGSALMKALETFTDAAAAEFAAAIEEDRREQAPPQERMPL